MNGPVRVACIQAEPVVFDRDATIAKVAQLAAEAAGGGATLALLPETFVPVYPSNRWVRHLAHGAAGTPLFGRLLDQSIDVPGPHSEELGAIA